MEDFTVEKLVEVFRVDDDGRKTSSLGFVSNETLAKAFANIQVDACFHKTEKAYVLTEGKMGFVLETSSVKILDDKIIKRKAQEAIRKKLSAEEAEILGLE